MEKTLDFWDHLDLLVQAHPLIIDRPKGSSHPRYPERIYPLDYGYLEGTTASDGAGVDVWRGSDYRSSNIRRKPNAISAVLATVDLVKNDCEVKILVDCSEADITKLIAFHNSGAMRAEIIRRPER